MSVPRIAMRSVSKRFGATIALDDVTLEAAAGEVHALVGENGAGKSTLMKVLSGAITPDAGALEIDGTAYRPNGPLDARAAGVSMIYQELTLAPHLSVEANILLGAEPRRRGLLGRTLLDTRRMRSDVQDALARLDQASIDPAARVDSLSIGLQQVVEVARALVSDARIVVMDEPTSSLSAADTERLFDVVQKLRERGATILYISHFLEELERIADRFTVLRDGRTAGTGTIADTPIDRLIELMVGRRVDTVFPRSERRRGEVVLSFAPRDGHPLTLHRGEVLGLGGLVGAGRTELVREIYGLARMRPGELTVKGHTGAAAPHARVAQGIGMLSEDRKDEGLAGGLSIEENLTLSSLAPYARTGWIDRRRRRASAASFMDDLGVRARDPEQPVGDLSGGNQQKIALARLLHQEADVLILDEPTRGIDIRSKMEIYERIDTLTRNGAAVLLVSSYLPELFGLSDRIQVMHRDCLSEARAVSAWTEERVMAAATAGESASAHSDSIP